MDDLISRQAAVDEIDEWIKAFLEQGHRESAADACLIQDGIIQLPSAQPDRYTIDCILYNLYNQLSHRVGTDAMVERKDWIEQLYEEIFGKGMRPVWMT